MYLRDGVVKLRLHIRVMREAWSLKRDACSSKSLKIERATPHARHAWCVMRIRLAYHDVILWILPGTPQDPCMWSRDNHVLTHL